jgi:hypothetical protein
LDGNQARVTKLYETDYAFATHKCENTDAFSPPHIIEKQHLQACEAVEMFVWLPRSFLALE